MVPKVQAKKAKKGRQRGKSRTAWSFFGMENRRLLKVVLVMMVDSYDTF